MSTTQATAATNPARREYILTSLKNLVNDLTGMDPGSLDIHANFLEAGIDSLTLIQATQLVKENYEVRLSVVQLLEQLTTLDSLASYIDHELPAEALAEELSAPTPAAPQPSGVATAPAENAAAPFAAEPSHQTAAAEPSRAPQPATAAADAFRQPAPAQAVSRTVQPERVAATPTAAPPAVRHRAAPSSAAADEAQGTALEQVVAHQLQVMSQQLEMLRAYRADGAEPQPSAEVQDPAGNGARPDAVADSSGVSAPGATREPANGQATPPPATAEVRAAAPAAGARAALSVAPAPYVPYQPIEPGTTGGLTARQQNYLDEFIARHNERTRESKRLTQEHRPHFSDSRSTVSFRLLWKELVYPIIGSRSRGSRIWDVDGNEYVDVSMGFGVHLFGHSPDFIVEALRRQIDEESLQLGPQSNLAGEVARRFSEVTGLERVNFCNSGTEAVMGAVRLARTVTRRSKLAIFAGAYHGWWDGTLAKPLTVKGEQRFVPIGPGISPRAVEDVIVLDWDSPASIEYLEKHVKELAAVMVEPVQSRRPDIQPREFLHELRRLTANSGTPLIFDEMITGFRIHSGGAQAHFGVEADIATYGKVIGGGMPVGIVAGKAAYMDAFDGGMWNYGDGSYPEAEKTIFAGAFFKHPLMMASALAILDLMRREPEMLPRLNRRAEKLVAALNEFFEAAELACRIVNFGSLFRFMFAHEVKFVDLFFYHMLANGIYIWEGRNCFLSTAHTDEDLERFLRAVEVSVRQMRDGGFWPEPSSRAGREGDPSRGGDSHAVASLSSPAVKAGAQGAASRNGGGGHELGAAGAGASGGAQARGGAAANVQAAPAGVVPARVNSLERDGGARAAAGAGTQFSLYYFGHYEADFNTDKYELLIEGTRYADQNGFSAVWIPERHFHAFGGFSPNPSVVAAALARETQRVHLRAGSVVLPLHNPIRVAEEWSVVDNLSRGRIGVSFASGWQPNDFVFAPDIYADRHEHMYRSIEVVRQLWRGEAIRVRSGDGKEIEVRLSPMPMQPELPLWLTGVSPPTFTKAGQLGARFLTNLQDQTVEELAAKIALYREGLVQGGHDPASGHVTLLLHTFMLDDYEQAKEKARQPFYKYMKSSLALMSNKAKGGKPLDVDALSDEDMAYILESNFERYIRNASLVGTPDSCEALVRRLAGVGVDEIACLVDFGIDTRSALESLRHVNVFKERFRAAPPRGGEGDATARAADSEEAGEAVKLIPLTDAQRQLWITTQIGEDASRAYNESATLKFRGPFDPEAMRAAIRQLVARHELLRATFEPGGEHQRINPGFELDIPLVDFSGVAEGEREAAVVEWITEEAGRVFDLSKGPLVRFRLVKLDERQHLLVLNNHHLVADGQSWGVLVSDLKAFYAAARQGRPPQLPPPTPFSEYAERQTRLQSRPAMREAEAYWTEMFDGGVPVLELPTDFPRPPVQTYNGRRVLIPTGPELFSALKRLCVERGSTVYMMLLAAYGVLLHRLSGQDALIVGSPAAGQMSVGSKEVVGYCVNLLPLLSRIGDDPKFGDYLSTVKRSVMEGFEHQHYSFGNLLKRLNVPWDASRIPLFTTIFNVDRAGAPVEFFDLEMEAATNPTTSARYDVRMNVIETEDELLLDCSFNTDLFTEQTVRRWMGHFQTLLRGVCADPDRRVKRLPLLDEEGERQVLAGWNDTRADYPHAEAYHRLFEAQAERTPEAAAVVFEGEELNYRELNAGANRLARYLRKQGVGPETTVAVCLERSARMILALLGVMKAGGAYVPLDTASPPERLRFTLEDCGARVVLAQEEWRGPLSETGVEVVSLDGDWEKIERESADNLEGGAGPDNLAYVIYTSGSTGRPKGVMVEQRQLLNYVRAVGEKLSLPEGASFATVSTLAADLGNTMLFPALCTGGTLHVMAEERVVNPDELADYFGSRGIDCLKIVPSHLEALLTARRPEQVLPRRRLILGGEAARTGLLERLGELAEPACEIFNHYGPTETTVGVLTYHAPADSLRSARHKETALPLGRPIPNARVYLLDARLQPVPPGVRGELYVGGEGVARGYLNRPDLTAERFIPDPFGGEPGARLYRTGDLGRYLPDGDIQFLGRSDDQVKVRGLRIELGEIEAALAEHEAVREAVIVAREDVPGERGLVAYVVTQPEEAVGVTQLREHLRRRLPEYMQPAAFVMLDRLPLTPNGKIDRRALPPPDGTRPELGEAFVAPRTPAEERLAAIWAEVLRLERVGVNDNFFNLGGNSLLGTQITARVRDRLRVELTLRNLFEAPTLGGLAALIAERRPEPESPSAAARPASDKSPDQILAALDQLPDEEVDSLLNELLAEEEAQ